MLSRIYPVRPAWESGHIYLFFFAGICHQARLRGDIIGADEYNASPVNNPPQEVLDKCEVFNYLGDETKLYDQIWTEIISEF